MKTPINSENVGYFAATNAYLIDTAVRGIALEFHGLGDGQRMIKETNGLGRYFAEKGILYVIPYYGPWSWMNDKAVKYTDEVVDALIERFGLPDGVPIVSTGLSMGGLSSIVYCAYAKRRPVACAANCPVCDLPYHYTEREDLPRTIYGAFSHYDMTLEEAMKRTSPIHLAKELPDIPYSVFVGTDDCEVDMHMHGERFCAEMKRLGRDVELTVMPGRGHCDLSPEALEKYRSFIASFC